ncbi:MAG: signal peptidase II [Alphaproteobacteria bacterium]|nr:signal peptidase II [Alphaproteobacteria bacterium]
MRKMPKCFSSKKLSTFALAFVFMSDQLSKLFVLLYLRENIALTPFFNIILVQNRGVTFGLFEDTIPPVILSLLALFIIAFLIVFMLKQQPYYRLPISVIIGGAIGNIFDRIRFGAVTDFLDFHLYQYHWPAFNIADTAIVLGTFSLLIISYIEEKK